MILWTIKDDDFCIQNSQSGATFEIKVSHDHLTITPIGKDRYLTTSQRANEIIIHSEEHKQGVK